MEHTIMWPWTPECFQEGLHKTFGRGAGSRRNLSAGRGLKNSQVDPKKHVDIQNKKMKRQKCRTCEKNWPGWFPSHVMASLRYQKKLVLHTMLCINVYVNVDIYILLCRVFVKIIKKWKSPAKLCSLVWGDRRKWLICEPNNGVTIAYTENRTRYKIYCMNHHELAWTIFHRGRNLQTNTCKTSTLENCISHRFSTTRNSCVPPRAFDSSWSHQ